MGRGADGHDARAAVAAALAVVEQSAQSARLFGRVHAVGRKAKKKEEKKAG